MVHQMVPLAYPVVEPSPSFPTKLTCSEEQDITGHISSILHSVHHQSSVGVIVLEDIEGFSFIRVDHGIYFWVILDDVHCGSGRDVGVV